MTPVERAAEVIETPPPFNPGGAGYRPQAKQIAQALADAGLLLSDEQSAVIDAAKAWRRAHYTVRFVTVPPGAASESPNLIAAVDALNEAGQ